MPDGILKPNEAATKLGVSVKTLQRWDKQGIFVAKRTPTDRRYYTKEQIEEYMRSDFKPKAGDTAGRGPIDRGVLLAYKEKEGAEFGYEYDENDNPVLVLVDSKTGDDALLDIIQGDYTTEFWAWGFDVDECLIYNALFDYVLTKIENGDEDATSCIYEILDEADSAEAWNRDKTRLGNIVRKYIIDTLSGIDEAND